MEQLLEHHYATTHITSLIPTPSSPPTNSQTTLLIKQTLSFLSLYRLPHPFFKSPEYAERWDHLARDAESRIEEYKRQHESMARGMLIRERESLWKHVNGADDPRRPITQLFRTSAYGYPADSAPEVFKMVSTVYRKMIHASRQIEHASAIVFVGHRDWDELSRWERINVALAAKEYFEEKRAIAQALQQRGKVGGMGFRRGS
ncbi:hypothetical protein BCR35DRAFT_332722 [Leucosporidium creatinivorum]|uniref:Uncharacterized protein n=1 Tax=Leucosporidium creatinivorum TaxID=106004 RepID=A0A1Y2EZA3_9BASI|nr:hypothetical protein BCR35DRAFT_332722 [Leucosporidium creatinivorum]